MRRSGKLRGVFYLNLLIVSFLILYKIYLNFFELNFEAVHAEQVERIEAVLKGRSSYSFAVVGNINNSIGIFERKIIPMLNGSGADFIISAGNAVSGGGEDKYRAIHRTLGRLTAPYLLTFGENEYSSFGGFRFYDHYGPYVFAFSAGDSRFIFLDSTGKTSWEWQLRWLEEELTEVPSRHIFLFAGHPVKPVEWKPIFDFDGDYLLDEDVRARLSTLVEQARVDAVFSADLALFSRQRIHDTEYVVTGGAGGLVLNNERSYYHYVQVDVGPAVIRIAPVRLDIGQHRVFRTLESLWFSVHSLFYVGYLNFLLLISVLIVVAIWLHRTVFAERNYYPDFDLPAEQVLERSINVAMFTNSFLPFIGGVPISIDRLRRSLKSLGHKVLIVAPRYPGEAEQEVEKDTLRLPSLFQRGVTGEVTIANIFLPRIFRSVADFHPDIIHLHHPFWLGTVGMFLGRRLKVPVVYTYHTRLEHYAHAVPLPGALFRNLVSHHLIRRFANRCDSIVVPTASAEHYLRMIGVKSPIFVQPTGIECERFLHVDDLDIERLRTRFGIGKERVLISVSRLSKEKNIDFLLDAIHVLVQRSNIPFKLLIIGDGPERGHFQERIGRLGLEKVVLLPGAVPPGEIPACYRLGDVFVFASLSETQGMVILEAMAAGLPVVAVRSSGIDDFIRDGFNGYKTTLHYGTWGGHIHQLLADPALCRQIGENAQKSAKGYCLEKFGQKITQVYAHVLFGQVMKSIAAAGH